jgi:photosystem II stability/assembly factor-like uncharacterized protein
MKCRTMLCWFVAAFVVTCGRGEAVAQTDFWQKINSPFGDSVNALANNASGTIFLGTNRGVSRSTDNGVTWTESNSSFNFGVGYFAFNSSGTIFAAGDGLFRSTDNGSNWTQIIHEGSVKSLAINDSGHIFIGRGAMGVGILRSTDNGASWINTGLDCNTLALAINASSTIFAGGWGSAGTGVFRSTDNGSSWTKTGSLVGGFYPVNTLAISPAGHIFAATTSYGVFHTTDNGAHWIWSSFGNIRTSYVTRLAINASGHIFAGTFSEGVYRSTDDGANWTTVNSGLTNDTVVSIAISASGTIFTVTQNGLFRSVQSTTSVRDLAADAPMRFSLDQNYPNPFNPTTTIRFTVPENGFTSLKVYNVLGQEVETLVNAQVKVGSNEKTFDARNLTSGVYFYKLASGSNSMIKKMMLLK